MGMRMNRIDRKFKELREKSRKGFIAYITAGDPTLKTTERLVVELEKLGVDILELGVPFSDPMADGLTNQKASERALKSNTSLKGILATVKKIRIKSNIPIILFTYLNPVFSYGWDNFAKAAKNCGVDGVLVLDLPIEESIKEKKILAKAGIKMIYLLAPTSTENRIKLTCRNASGFIYYVSRTGVTGARESLETSVKPMVDKIKNITRIPVAVGFGISRPEHIKSVCRYADAVIVGSAIVSKIEDSLGKKNIVENVCRFVKSLTKAL